jgi:glycerophosphoryl diester phosphodiesterase
MHCTLPDVFLTVPVAHRALHDAAQGRPENSRAAVQAAVDAGYAIEIDVQPSSDGVPMVFHDYHLHRLTDTAGSLSARPSAALRTVQLKGAAETIPTLSEILSQVAGRVPLLIEIKDQHGDMGPVSGALEQAVAALLTAYKGPVAVMSFNPHSMAVMAGTAPSIPRGLVTSAFHPADWPLLSSRTRDVLRGIPDYDDVGACFISHEATDLGRPRVADLKSEGAGVLCWTIRSAEAEAEARKVAANVTFEGYLAVIPA